MTTEKAMSEQAAMTVEQALALVREYRASGFTYSSWHAAAIVLADGVERLRKENANFATMAIAAAEEISEHWDAHCNDEGYGPSNLLCRLEAAIPAEYGYTAGAYRKIMAERDELRRRVAELIHYPDCWDTVAYPELKNALDNIDADYQGCTECAEKSIAKVKAEAVREAKKNIVVAGMHRGNAYDQGFIDAIDAYDEQMGKYANQIEGGA